MLRGSWRGSEGISSGPNWLGRVVEVESVEASVTVGLGLAVVLEVEVEVVVVDSAATVGEEGEVLPAPGDVLEPLEPVGAATGDGAAGAGSALVVALEPEGEGSIFCCWLCWLCCRSVRLLEMFLDRNGRGTLLVEALIWERFW